MVEGAAATAQRLMLRLNLARGTWFEDLSRGVPYDQVLDKVTNTQAIENEFRSVIIGTRGVKQLNSFSFQITSDRLAAITFEVLDESGEVITEQDVGLV